MTSIKCYYIVQILLLLLIPESLTIAIKFLETEKCESLSDKEIIENCNAKGCCFNMSLTFVKPILKIYVSFEIKFSPRRLLNFLGKIHLLIFIYFF